MSSSFKDILEPVIDSIAEESSRHPVYDWGSYEDTLGIERFLGFSLSRLCDTLREQGWKREEHTLLTVDAFLDEFRSRGLGISEDRLQHSESCTWYIVSVGNLEYNIRKQQYQILVKIRGNESPGWSSEIMTSPKRFADYLIEFDSCVDWMRHSYLDYLTRRQKERMVERIKAVTMQARIRKPELD